jgi:hypothetical protein
MEGRMSEVVETIARASAERLEAFDVHGIPVAIITALEANGYAIVPCEPSEAMWDAAMREGYDQDPATYYRAMISTGKANME